MTERSNEYKLAAEIVALSVASRWDEAKLEWTLDQVYRQDKPETCLCGHYPIVEICVLRNRRNGNMAIVGNVCVKKFMRLPSDKIFQALKRVTKDPEKPLNAEAIAHAYEKNWINKWEHRFYLDTRRKRTLTDKQMSKRRQINQEICTNMNRKKVGPTTP